MHGINAVAGVLHASIMHADSSLALGVWVLLTAEQQCPREWEKRKDVLASVLK